MKTYVTLFSATAVSVRAPAGLTLLKPALLATANYRHHRVASARSLHLRLR